MQWVPCAWSVTSCTYALLTPLHDLVVSLSILKVKFVVVKGLPGVNHVLTSPDEQLVLELFELSRARIFDQAFTRATTLWRKKRIDIVAFALVLVEDLLPFIEQVTGLYLRDPLVNITNLDSFFKVKKISCFARNLQVCFLKLCGVGLLIYVDWHLHQVVDCVRVHTLALFN